MMRDFWNERYSEEKYAYGEEPNDFFRSQIDELKPGKILFPAEGEGRNAVYAASIGWDVKAFDLSYSGKEKADRLALKKGVDIDYSVGTLEDLSFEESSFHVIALIFAHFAPEKKGKYHKRFIELLKPGGVIIFEAFSKDHLEFNAKNPRVGGPKNSELLYSKDELLNYFKDFKVDIIAQEEVQLSEGEYHQGAGSVVRFVGKKKF